MASTITNGFLKRLADGTLIYASVTVKVMLLNIAYVPDPDHEFVSSLSAFELSGTGYTGGFGGGGRKTLAGKTVTKDDTLNEVRFDATDPTWAAIDAGTAGFMAFINEVTNDAASPVLGIVSLGPSGVITQGGTLTVALGTYGLKLKA